MGIGGPLMRRAVFLDRDGVVNRALIRNGRPHPPRNVSELQILPQVPEALGRLSAAGFLLIVVTNQPDVARGTATRESVEEINSKLSANLPLDALLTCYHDDAEHCDCRKPKPGLLFQARDRFSIDLSRSFMIGDRWRDVEAGINAGCRTVFIDYHYDEPRPAAGSLDFSCASLDEAASWILSPSEEQEAQCPSKT
jgi:D-glycero-D-manno-heptose 1,7-bisphosphate phosphatase